MEEIPHPEKLKILIAEDDPASFELFRFILEAYQHHLIHLQNGQEVVDACRKHPDTDLILMDIKMPVMDGHEATRQIRTFNREVAIIAQTAHALPGDEEKALAAGCDGYITKPIRKKLLLDLIRKLVRKPN